VSLFESPKVKQKIASILAILAVIPIVAATACTSSEASALPPQQRLRVATTTSLYDTGLWEFLEPMFEEKYGVELDIMNAGTGKALEYGRRGDVHIVAVHSREREEQFIEEGYGVERVPFAYNYFLIIGPEIDPAGIKGLSPEEAFRKLIDNGSGSFVSRGDDSGTHAKEKQVWEQAGYDYETVRDAGTWYIEGGTGMGPTLMMASEKEAYTITDMGTYLSYKGKLELVPMIDKGDILLNVYSAIAIRNISASEMEMANNLISFLTSPEIQEVIGSYGVEQYGTQLFIPCAGEEPE